MPRDSEPRAASAPAAGLSVLLPTFNEADKVARVLESVKWADEILVVDSFSTDGTREIAARYGARVVQHEYVNSATQKNWALPQCRHEWVLQVDADEEVEPALKEEIRAVLAGAPADVDGYLLPFRHHILGAWVGSMGLHPGPQLRLFRRDRGRWQDREVDARVVVPGRVKGLRNHLLHFGFESVSQRLRSLDRYTRYEADERFKQGRRFSVADLVGRSLAVFLHKYFWQLGFTAGVRGLIHSMYRVDFMFWTYAKLWEREVKRVSHAHSPPLTSGPPRVPSRVAELSVLLPTFNEADNMARVLESVKWADEILVVDSFSTDGTPEIAARYGARVIQHEYVNSATQKNWAVPQCRHEWVLEVDADEEVEPALQAEIRAMLADPPAEVDGYRLRRRNHLVGVWVKTMALYPDPLVRLFRRDRGRWQDREVDAHLVVPGRVEMLHNDLLHFGFETMSQRLRGLDRYTRYESDQRFKERRRFGVASLVGRTLGVFLHKYVWQLGFTAGVRGLIHAMYRMDFMFWTYAKLWEKELKQH